MLATGHGRLSIDPACVEARGLALGLRRAWRLRLPSAELSGWRRVWQRNSLHLCISQQRFHVEQGGHLRVLGKGRGADGVHLVVISAEAAFARACLGEELRNVSRQAARDRGQLRATLDSHRRLGVAYGYPPCCVEAFCDAHAETVVARHRHRHFAATGRPAPQDGDASPALDGGDNGLAIARAAARSRDFDPLLAAIPGELGDSAASTLRHLPCRFDCTASRQLAVALLADLEKTDSRRHKRLKYGLLAPIWIDRMGHATVAISAATSAATPADPGADRWRVSLPDERQVFAPVQPSPGRPQLPLLLPFHLFTS